VALKDKKAAGDHNLKWVWKRIVAHGQTLMGFLENDGRQLDANENDIKGEKAKLVWTTKPKNQIENFFHIEPIMQRIY